MTDTDLRTDPALDGLCFRGLWVALATPFADDHALDLAAYGDLARRCLAGGADGLLALGSTGEASTLDDDERDRVIATCLEAAAGVPVMVGTGSNDTRRAVRATRRARALGAQAALIVTPYYNKPNDDGLVTHFETIAEAVPDLPLVAYNVPGRTGHNLTPEALGRLWQIPTLRAIKESSGDLHQIDRVVRHLPPGRTVLAGDDALALPAIALGAAGLVSVAANVAPTAVRRLVDAAVDGRLPEARAVHEALSPLMEALFVESNPVPLKAALQLLAAAGDTVRPPLARASSDTRLQLAAAIGELEAALGEPTWDAA